MLHRGRAVLTCQLKGKRPLFGENHNALKETGSGFCILTFIKYKLQLAFKFLIPGGPIL